MNKILIVVKDLRSRGGVANYYRVFLDHFQDENWQLQTFFVGRRAEEYYQPKSFLKYTFQYFRDLVKFINILFHDRDIRIVQLNPSFTPIPILRDGLLLLLSHFMGRKSILFIRGWDDDFAMFFNRHNFVRKMMAWLFKKADIIIVLGECFKQRLIAWGITEDKIKVSYTLFDGRLVVPYHNHKTGSEANFLFLGRISREKGIFEILEAASLTKEAGFNFRITLAGFAKDDRTMSELKKCLKSSSLENVVTVKGYLDGSEKYHEYSQADVFLLPSYHPEGCPNSVLEAMASGLFIICSDAGSLSEIVKNKSNGFIVKARDPESLAAMMCYVLEHPDEIRQKGKNNIQYAFENFEAKKIIKQFKKIYHEMTDNCNV